jgi:hypothetical protein
MVEESHAPIPRSLQDAFWGAIGAYSHWSRGEPEPRVSLEGQEVPIGLICDLVTRYQEAMPDNLWQLLKHVAGTTAGMPQDRSFASAARWLGRLIAERQEWFSRPDPN